MSYLISETFQCNAQHHEAFLFINCNDIIFTNKCYSMKCHVKFKFKHLFICVDFCTLCTVVHVVLFTINT